MLKIVGFPFYISFAVSPTTSAGHVTNIGQFCVLRIFTSNLKRFYTLSLQKHNFSHQDREPVPVLYGAVRFPNLFVGATCGRPQNVSILSENS